MSDETTEILTPRRRATEGAPAAHPCLMIAWSATEPGRVGEVLWVPGGDPVFFGRTGAGLMRQRPGHTPDVGPPTCRRLSRSQLRVQRVGRKLHLENVGRARLYVDGQPTDQALVTVGARLLIEGAALLWVVDRPARLPPLRTSELPDFAWAEADPDGIVGESPAAWALRDQIAFVGPRAGHVLVLGKSGTGKELVARAMHRHSSRRAANFVARNAATLPETLVDAELFGHARDYPNSGMPARPGLVGEADGGTLFLDEIGELPVTLQAHLLRLMDGGEYQRLGEPTVRRADVRVVAATNRPRAALKADFLARFRHVVEVPDLDARRADVPLIARFLLRQAAAEDAFIAERFVADGEPRISAELAGVCLTHPLPLQVRELDALLWRSLGHSRGEIIEPAPDLDSGDAGPTDGRAPASVTKAELEAALAEHDGVQSKVWRALGLQNRYVLRRLLKKHGIT